MTRHLRASFGSAAIPLTLGITAQAQAAFVTGIRPRSKNFQTAGDPLSRTDGTAAARSCWRVSHLIVTANCKAGSYLPLRQTNFSPSDRTAKDTRLVKDINPGSAPARNVQSLSVITVIFIFSFWMIITRVPPRFGEQRGKRRPLHF